MAARVSARLFTAARTIAGSTKTKDRALATAVCSFGAYTAWQLYHASVLRHVAPTSPFREVLADSAQPDHRRHDTDQSGFRGKDLDGQCHVERFGSQRDSEDPETSVPFPLHLSLSTPSPILTLVGLGVRKVSFLRVKVYSAGFYIEDRATKQLDSYPGWHSFSAQHLLTPPTGSPSDPLGAPQLSGEGLIKSLLDEAVTCAVRIVPVRTTDFGHLRDGFVRALATRQKLARSAGELTPNDEERIAGSLQQMKSFFPKQSVPKGQPLVLLRTGRGELVVEYEGKVLGQIHDAWVAREMMLAYFADKDVISPKLKEDVAHGLEKLIKH